MENTAVFIKQEPSSRNLFMEALERPSDEDELDESKIRALLKFEETNSFFGLCETEFASSSPKYGSDNIEEIKSTNEIENYSQNANNLLNSVSLIPAAKKRIRRRSTVVIKCDICDYKTTHAGNLKRHIMSCHSNEKPYACNLCEFRTSLSNALRVHMKVHSTEKSYACALCEYKTSRSYDLTRHLRTHTGERPYYCHVCDYRSSHSGHLKKHLMKHSGEKPYHCNLCSYRSIHGTLLKAHMKSHSGEKPYACTICDYKTYYNSGLRSHLLARHRPTSNVIEFEFVPVVSN